MADKYFVDQVGNNSVKIADDVITKIAQEAAIRVDGVVNNIHVKREGVRDILKVGNPNKMAKITSDELQSVIDMSITVEYGKNILEVAEEVQEKVKESIDNMTDLDIVAVNVHVNGVRLNEGDKVNLSI
ncbi:Asp23/Gls24 family envelope stress response protein [Peptoniphilus sp. KCTC 25270]|uniref:Asp23/Gls24 family envelope stress response protein n=1 Tax=Peptoniphilus sp. KCTC 25270 TaxID=2897414 RepID=UPI001E4C0806|nr:Asp23/Gls24 family envelope stress response protein [Peptoniphilus sp. KCTC 25270]MCD1147150.1 Asp23/Gls24 family envelope stress response protein [Peptoniphilus sp. KCTC 25270]